MSLSSADPKSAATHAAAPAIIPFIEMVLDPRAAFASPDAVARHARLSREEKRVILWGWARDLLRQAHDGVSDIDEIEAALLALSWFDAAAAHELEDAFPAGEEPDAVDDEGPP